MEQEEVKSYLSDWIANEVVRFAEIKDYPFHPFICQDSYVEGFKLAGVNVVLNKEKKAATFGFNLNVLGKKHFVPLCLKYNQILAGEGSLPMSTNSLIFSVARLCFDAGVSVEESYGHKISVDQKKSLTKSLEQIACNASRGMESIWREYAQKYHENILITPDGVTPSFNQKSLILPRIYGSIDWKELGELEEADFISEGERRDFRENVTIYFFEELAKTKGFPLKEISPLSSPDIDPVNMFVEGSEIKWRNLEKFLC